LKMQAFAATGHYTHRILPIVLILHNRRLLLR